MASCAPACCICWAMAQAMLRLLATPNTTAVRPSKQFDIRCHSSARNTAKWLRISARARDVSLGMRGLPRPQIPLPIGLTFGIYSLAPHAPQGRLASGNRREVAAREFTGVGEPEYCSVEYAED